MRKQTNKKEKKQAHVDLGIFELFLNVSIKGTKGQKDLVGILGCINASWTITFVCGQLVYDMDMA